MEVETSRHYYIHYYENSISEYQLISKEHYWLIVLIIHMNHYISSAAIYKISCSKRVAPNFSFNFRFNYLECWKKQSPQKKSSFCRALYKQSEFFNKDLNTKGSDSILILPSCVQTNIFWFSVLQIIATQKTDIGVEKEE